MTSTGLVGYFALFAVFGFFFLFGTLVFGWLMRPKNPSEEKLEIYECGEPPIGSSYIQFDLRFYVVALIFLVFDVEVAFFFPWATVFGTASNLKDPNLIREQAVQVAESGEGFTQFEASPAAAHMYESLGAVPPAPVVDQKGVIAEQVLSDATILANYAFVDILVFFGVLLVGFAYVWRRGDIDWVRAVSEESKSPIDRTSPVRRDREISATSNR